MSNVIRKVKDLTKSKEQKLLEKYDVVDECGDLTDTGQRLVIEKALAAHKAEIVADLEKVQSDEDKKRK